MKSHLHLCKLQRYVQNKYIFYLFIASLLITVSCQKSEEQERKPTIKQYTDNELQTRADSLAEVFIIADTHIDLPYRLNQKMEDITRKTNGNFDYPSAIRGGLNIAFMSIYTSASLEPIGKSKEKAELLIDIVEKLVVDHPNKFALAYSVADVTEQFYKSHGRIVSLPMGMENGSPIEGNLGNIKYFYNRGIRYITLAHSKSNHISDSSYDTEKKWNGLSPFGKEVVKEMNRLGIIIDVSHISDSAFYDVMELSKAPVIASHSSCRYFTPGWERNISDEMIRILAEKGGVIQINFGSAFLKDDVRRKSESSERYLQKYIREHNLSDEEAHEFRDSYLTQNKPGETSVKDVVAHIDHIVKLVGINYVGLGSDFDGVDALPQGLGSASDYPNLIYALLKLGYSDKDINKICSGNFLRVWSRVEKVSDEWKENKKEEKEVKVF